VQLLNNVLKSHPAVKKMRCTIRWKKQKRQRNETEDEKQQRLREKLEQNMLFFIQDGY